MEKVAVTRKTILMISYFYPPRGGMGTIRTVKFVKFLIKSNWQSVVLTTNKGQGIIPCDESEGNFKHAKIVKSNYFNVYDQIHNILFSKRNEDNSKIFHKPSDVKTIKVPVCKKLFGLIWTWLQFPDSTIGWYPFAVKKALEVSARLNVDVIYSTSPPETSHLIASRLKTKTGLPWVADLRDLWTQNPYSARGRIRQFFERILERKVLERADALITVSKPLAMRLSSGLGIPYDKVHVIPNGFDPDDFSEIQKAHSEKFTLTYTGRLYRFKRNPELLFKTVSNLIRKGKLDKNRIALNFYVGDLAGFYYFIKKYSLQEILNVFDFVPYQESLKQQKKSTVLLLFQSDSTSDFGVYTGKLFEYLGAGRPILSIPSSSEVIEELLKKTNAGIAVSNEDELENQLIQWYQEFLATGTVNYKGNKSEISKYTREESSRKLASILDGLSSSSRDK
jgi:glycosyltransferase involved in cell wall biosynthesis